LTEFGLLVLEKNTFKIFVKCLSLLLLSPLGEQGCLHFYNFEPPLPEDDLCQLWLNWPGGLGKVENEKV
jgi:hypothetical protein